jgi:hypothetical protein
VKVGVSGWHKARRTAGARPASVVSVATLSWAGSPRCTRRRFPHRRRWPTSAANRTGDRHGYPRNRCHRDRRRRGRPSGGTGAGAGGARDVAAGEERPLRRGDLEPQFRGDPCGDLLRGSLAEGAALRGGQAAALCVLPRARRAAQQLHQAGGGLHGGGNPQARHRDREGGGQWRHRSATAHRGRGAEAGACGGLSCRAAVAHHRDRRQPRLHAGADRRGGGAWRHDGNRRAGAGRASVGRRAHGGRCRHRACGAAGRARMW